MSRFTHQGSQSYDARIQKLIPGYALLQQLTTAKLRSLLPSAANLLIVGVGTGSETLTFAKANTSWTFTAVDISADMLDLARQNFAKANLENRINIHHGELSTVPTDQTYDVAICFFVLHFLPNDGSKEALLFAIQQRLKPSCFLFIADLMQPLSSLERRAQAIMSQQLGLSDEQAQQMLERLNSDFYPLSDLELEHLARETRFSQPIQYFQALGFHSHMLKHLT
ncbi:MAG: class I SAM-dependent methyltransferase [Cyanobacteria bacterium P01_G01_bin.54]